MSVWVQRFLYFYFIFVGSCSVTVLIRMDTLQKLSEIGTSLGYEGEALRDFIKEQQALQRDERQKQREREREKENLELQKQKLEQEQDERQKQREREREKENVELQKQKLEQEQALKLQELEHKQKLELLSVQAETGVKVPKSDDSQTCFKFPKIPTFDDHKDEMDSYLLRFERYAEAQQWPKKIWATNLSALLRGKALDVYALLPSAEALNYDALKSALLKRYDLTEDGFKRKFRSCRPEMGETFSQFSVRMSNYLNRWIEMSKIAKSFDGLYDLILRDQFLNVCNRDLALFLK